MHPQIAEDFEDLNAALADAVRQLGGNKQVGSKLWPEMTVEHAANRLRDSLNPERREKLSPEQALWIIARARQAGHHGAMHFIATQAGYEPPRPVEPQDLEAELQRRFCDAVEGLQNIQQQLQRMQRIRQVG